MSQPDTGEQALEITDALVRSGSVDLIVIDSVAALTPRSEIEGDMGEALPGLQARLMSQALRKLTASITKTKTLVIFINQIRMKIGVTYGSPEVTTGGNALKFYSSVRIDIRRKNALKKGEEVYGSETRVKVVKIRWRLPLRKPVLTSFTGKASPTKANSLTSVRTLTSSIRAAPGTATKAPVSVRVRTTPATTLRNIRRWPLRLKTRSVR